MAGSREPGQGGRKACKTVSLGTVQTLQPKVCVDCGATKTPLWRCNVDGVKSLCNRCGVRLYREQKRARRTDDRVSLNDDGWDDSSSCTNSASNIATADSQPDLASRKRQAAQWAPSRAPGLEAGPAGRPGMQNAISLDDAAGLVGQPTLPSNSSLRFKRVRSSEVSLYSSGSDDDFVVMTPASQSPESPIIIQAQQALKQAWPSLAKGPLGHLWEAGLDPLDPLFLANINDPTALLAQEEEFQSQIDLLLHPLSCYSSDERYPSSF
ncbi:g12159 [Coccomyxa viridis]|uniref:G12159 protein n=1 Tax=Coccomyxa viridis TaxID=1274662 RepID=A0ABP1GCC2_9CHLO